MRPFLTQRSVNLPIPPKDYDPGYMAEIHRLLTQSSLQSSTNGSGVKAYLAADQSIPDSGYRAISFGAEDFDFGDLYSPTVNPTRLTIPSGGNVKRWLLLAQIGFASSATGARVVEIRDKNGTAIGRHQAGNAGATLSTILPAYAPVNQPSVGDWFETYVYQTSGGPLNATAGISVSFFSAFPVGG